MSILKICKPGKLVKPALVPDRSVRYSDVEVMDEGGFECPDGVYDVHVIGLKVMKVTCLNGYWFPRGSLVAVPWHKARAGPYHPQLEGGKRGTTKECGFARREPVSD